MARERTTRQPAGPGRTVRRPRSPKSAVSASEAPTQKLVTAKPRRRPIAPRFRDIGFTTVSYTHLDVYKRQVPSNVIVAEVSHGVYCIQHHLAPVLFP